MINVKVKLDEKETAILLDSLIQSMSNVDLGRYDNSDIANVYNKILEGTKVKGYGYF